MVNYREARIAMDYLTGMTVATLADREGVTPPRIYQMLHKVAWRVMGRSSITTIFKDDVTQFKARLYDIINPPPRRIEPGEACTPEQFFYEMLGEKKTRNYGEVPDPVLHEERPMESDIG
jgi:hypothetical protein